MRLFVRSLVVGLVVVTLLMGSGVGALAHQTKPVGDGAYLLIVGMLVEPAYTEQRNGLDIIVREAATGEPVEHLEQTLFAEIIAPDGRTKRSLPLRAQYGKAGSYTTDFVLTRPGVYTIRIWGMIHDVAFDEEFQSHEVGAWEELRFP